MWPVTSTQTKYENPWIRIREDKVVRPDGSPGLFGVIEVQSEAVFVVAMTDDDRVWLVTVDRHTTGMSQELPAGGTDGQGPLVAAQRELAEETGLQASHWQRIGGMNALNGVAVAPEHVFLATGLSPVEGLLEQDAEGITGTEALPWSEVMQRIRDGRIVDGESIASLMFAALALGRVN
ncbi:NUDIX domain-containing protein [Luteococcus sp. Sow4_B9]|uniref:NUDIX domain-containing protein n=1 Tax=Luteococcus sp. Sow4_B9 TaxID=3438792 RepID=UPI003F9959F1